MKFVIALVFAFVVMEALAMLIIHIHGKRTYGFSDPYFSWVTWRPAAYGMATSVLAVGGGFLILTSVLHLLGAKPLLGSYHVERASFDQQIAALRNQVVGLKHQIAALQQRNQTTRN